MQFIADGKKIRLEMQVDQLDDSIDITCGIYPTATEARYMACLFNKAITITGLINLSTFPSDEQREIIKREIFHEHIAEMKRALEPFRIKTGWKD